METNDLYKIIAENTEEVLFKDRNSKFFGYAFPISNEDEIRHWLEVLKKQHHSARHWCYAWQLGVEKPKYRANDDGEPSNSAGMPIYGQIKSFELTNILIVVVRYFGGVKLGVGGLINAYRTAAKMAIEVAKIEEKTIDVKLEIGFDYKNMNKVMRIIKEKNLKLVDQKMEMNCTLFLSVRKKQAPEILEIFNSLFEVSVKKLEN
ncbi:YigZ family protein [Leptobacterium flavescens]|uniref:YigZ family protein n=1 Tax=Leptobacterium flavescens TaxID=472055 RepID=A0A6P0UR10_9FLAO|nr:YigZ family protein [Leptobacterium flavescens]NER13293.1 YigZ family protein [Leptobacterium flavescens]